MEEEGEASTGSKNTLHCSRACASVQGHHNQSLAHMHGVWEGNPTPNLGGSSAPAKPSVTDRRRKRTEKGMGDQRGQGEGKSWGKKEESGRAEERQGRGIKRKTGAARGGNARAEAETPKRRGRGKQGREQRTQCIAAGHAPQSRPPQPNPGAHARRTGGAPQRHPWRMQRPCRSQREGRRRKRTEKRKERAESPERGEERGRKRRRGEGKQ